MPGLKCFGKRWKVGSDDFVFSGILEIVIRIIWLVAIAVILHTYKDAFTCNGGHMLWTYHIGVLTLISLGIVLTVIMTVVSSRGSITNSRPRRSIPLLIYLKLILAAPELAWNCLGTYWAFGDSSGCDWKVVATVKGAVIFGWIVAALAIIGILVLVDPVGHTDQVSNEPKTLESNESRQFLMGARSSAKRVWEKRCELVCCCVRFDPNHTTAFTDIAELISDFFHSVDVVPTDIAAGMLLVYRQQSAERDKLRSVQVDPINPNTPSTSATVAGSDHTHTSESIVDDKTSEGHQTNSHHTEAVLSDQSGHQRDIRSTADTGVHPQDVSFSEPVVKVTAPSVPSQVGRVKEWMTVDVMAHYMKFAAASYGWPFYMYTHLYTGMCRLWGECRCCSCRAMPDVSDDNACYCNTAALKKRAHLTDDDLVHVSYHNKIYEIPFFVALDRERNNVVVAIRGTLSLRDALTDMTADCDMLEVDAITDAYAHRGILSAARYIQNTLERKHLLDRAFSLGQDFGLVITGHSLGAGAAAILAILLRPTYPSLKCFAFSPPGGLLSPSLATYSKDFTCSIILGKDLVPRLSIRAMNDLKVKIINVVKSCNTPKYKILLGGCWHVFCGVNPIDYQVSSSNSSQPLIGTTPTPPTQYSSPQEGEEQERHHSVNLPQNPRPLIPPGHLLHVTRVKVPKSSRDVQYTGKWSAAEQFDEIIVSPHMVTDHVPDAVIEALNSLTEKQFSIGSQITDTSTVV